jgi:hypothetical protein
MLELVETRALVLDANPIESPIAWIVGSIGSYVGSLHPREAVLNPLGLLLPLQDPMTAVARDPLARIVPSGGDFQKIAGSIQAVGYVLLAILLVARMLRLAATGHLRSPEHVLLDLVPKLVLGVLAIQYFDRVLNDLGRLSMAGAFLLEDALLGPINIRNAHDILSAFPTDGFGVVLLPVLYLLVAYLLLLVVTSRLVLVLGALISPLGIPIALQNAEGRLAGSWIRMLVSGLLVPVVAGIGTAGSLALAWLVHQVAGNGPFFGSDLGAVAGECGLFFTAFATTAMFKDAVRQGMAGVRGSFEATPIGPVAGAPSEALDHIRRGAGVATGVAMTAAGIPMGVALAARAASSNPNHPESDSGGGAAPPVPPLPGGPGGTGGGAQTMPPAPSVPRLPGRSGGAGVSSQLMLPEPPTPGAPNTAETPYERHRLGGGQVIHEFERRQQVRYATYLSEPVDDADREPEPGRAVEV